MSEKKIALILSHMAEAAAPGDAIDLWPQLLARLQARSPQSNTGVTMKPYANSSKRLRAAALIVVACLLAAGFFLSTTQGQVWAQSILHFFTRAESDTLPVQSWQQEPIPTRASPDPSDINSATRSVAEVEGLAGFNVLEPTHLPDTLTFAGANIDESKKIAYLFYRFEGTNGLVLRQEPFQQADDCELCGEVGASAEIQTVQIGDTTGEYVEGVWNLTDDGPVWVADPFLKTLRWQAAGMAFELLYMGPPDSLTQAQMTAIAESLRP